MSYSPYKITVQNITGAPLVANIFGFNKFWFDSSFGNPVGIKIDCDLAGVEYSEILAQSRNNFFLVNNLRITTNNIAQFNNQILINTSDGTGKTIKQVIDVFSFLSPNQKQNNLIDINQSFTVDASDYLSATIEANTSITYTIFASFRIDIKALLDGQSVVEKNKTTPLRTFKS